MFTLNFFLRSPKIYTYHDVIGSVPKFQLKLSLKLQLKLIRNLAKVSMKLHVKFHTNFQKHETSMELYESSMKLKFETSLNWNFVKLCETLWNFAIETSMEFIETSCQFKFIETSEHYYALDTTLGGELRKDIEAWRGCCQKMTSSFFFKSKNISYVFQLIFL